MALCEKIYTQTLLSSKGFYPSLLWPFLPRTLESKHQDNEQDLQWCLSWLTELCKSTPSKRHVCHAWVHLLLKTNVHLKIKFLILLADESAMLMKIIKTSEYKFIVSSPHCHHLVVIVQPLCFQNNWVILTRHRASKLDILFKILIYLTSVVRHSKFQLTCSNPSSTFLLHILWHVIVPYIFLPVMLFNFLNCFLLWCFYMHILKSYQTSYPISTPSPHKIFPGNSKSELFSFNKFSENFIHWKSEVTLNPVL